MSRIKEINTPAKIETIEEDIITIHHFLYVGKITAVVVQGSTVDGVFVPDMSIPERNCPIDEGDYEDLVKDKPNKQFTTSELWTIIDRIDVNGHKPLA